jgi:tetratricopeptide (TPR) repeat protein
MGDLPAPLKQIHALRAAAASGRDEALRGALAEMPPTLARVGRALVAADRGDWERVVELLAGARNVPWILDGLVSLALTRALTHTDQLGPAEQVANGRLKRAPDDLDVRAERARAWFRAGHYGPAREEFQAVLEQVPTHAGALLGKGELALARGDLAEASDSLQAACVTAPLAAEPVVALARLFLVAGRPADGARQVAALLTVGPRPDDPRLTSSLAELHVAAEQMNDVVPLLERLGQRVPMTDAQRIELARLWAETGRSGPIRSLAEQSTGGARSLLLGIAARLEGTSPLPHLDDAAVALPDHWWVHEQRAESLLDAGDLDAAMSAATVAQRLAPRAAATRVASAAVLVRQQDHPGARRLLQVASEHAGLWPSVRARARSALAQD